MSVPKGTITCGVQTLEDIRERCYVDPDTNCWQWRGALTNNRYPSLWMPTLRKSVTIGQAIGYLSTGKVPGPGASWHSTCKNAMCANPAHRRKGTRATQMKAYGIERNPLTRARIAAAKAGQGKLTDEDAKEIRDGDLTLKQIAARWGICISYASEVRAGKRRGEKPAAQGASVFGWRP
jgi:hypothetical protein